MKIICTLADVERLRSDARLASAYVDYTATYDDKLAVGLPPSPTTQPHHQN